MRTTPQSWLDSVAAYDASRKIVGVVLGGDSGDSGDSSVRVNGLGAFGPSVPVTVNAVPGSGRHSEVAAPTVLSTSTMPVSNGSVTVPVNGMTAEGAYRVVVTPSGGPTSTWQQVYFTVNVPTARTSTMAPRYANGTGATSTHGPTYNGGAFSTVPYPPTAGWAHRTALDHVVRSAGCARSVVP